MSGESQETQPAGRRDRSSGGSPLSATLRSVSCTSVAGILILLYVTGAGALEGTCKNGELCSSASLEMKEFEDEIEETVRSGSFRKLLQACDPPDCHGHGTCTGAMCQCEEGWNAALNCSVPQDCKGLAGCSGHGICMVGGTCLCDPGWEGLLCQAASCPKNCSGHGTCMNGVCQCDLMWDNDRACSVMGCSGNCSSHGICVGGECECDLGWGGSNCNMYVCQNDCSGHGVCDSDSQRCVCSPWYTGIDCSTALCPRDCSGHGMCASGECVCDVGYGDFDCSIKTCNAGCSGHGICQPDGICSCQNGFFGDSCNSTIPDGTTALCPMDCSGHGLCEAPSCVCEPGWSGVGCEFQGDGQDCLRNCSSRGVCMNSTCICDLNWEGLDCSLPVSCPNSCSSHGSCLNGTCVCDLGWQGSDCSSVDGVSFCSQNCTSGVGVFRNGTCDCQAGVTGIDTVQCPGNCTGNGACMDGTCHCDNGYTGIDCSELEDMLSDSSGLCLSNCSMRGACINGTCVCDLGWTGPACSISATTSGCPSNCNGNGACVNSSCVCDPGFSGMDCSMSASTSGCASNCTGHGACFNQTCLCDAGWHSGDCSMPADLGATPVPVGFTPVSSMMSCEEGCVHGTCIAGVCFCDPFYTGPSCEDRTLVVMMGCPNECSQHGTCVNGTCICDRSWGGVDCSQLNVCPGWSEIMGANCSGNGLCVNGTCACSAGWSGMDCSAPACQSDCSGHGICANGTCACDFGWRGGACNDISCPGDCSGHGFCAVLGDDTGHPVCVCDAGWGGSDCKTRVCPSEDPELVCSGNGACAQNGTCICYENYVGDDCSLLVDCSGRGTRKCGFCQCLEGFEGELCEIDVCADSRIFHPEALTDVSLSTVCSGQGRCTTELGCVCQTGFGGKNCSQPAVCPTNAQGLQCSGRGTCYGTRDSPGICDCQNYTIANSPFPARQFMGDICETLLCPGYIEAQDQQCSGRGTCTGGTCACWIVNNEGVYSGSDCGVPPNFYVSSIRPQVSHLEGGTLITLQGPGLDRLFGTFADIYCSFGTESLPVPASIGVERDSLLCRAPAQASPRVVTIRLTDETGTDLEDIRSEATFEYYVKTNVIRVLPTFGPLRPTPVGAFNQITVTGSYFPFKGDYVCRFGDCESEPAVRVDAASITCRMPVMAKGTPQQISVSSNAQNYSDAVGVTFTTYEVTSITPKCGSQEGLAIATVNGRFLVDENDLSRNSNNFYCRFGSGSIIFYSAASISSRVSGALECPVPSRNLELENAFALSLDASTEDDGVTFDGRWDSTDTVTFDTYYPPIIGQIGDAKAIAPTVGPTVGGTEVTISGQGFTFSQYGPSNPFFDDWEPKIPGCNPSPIPTCRFGTTVTAEVRLLDHNTVVCTSPALSGALDQTRTVLVEVALDGQTYTSGGQQFRFTPPGHVEQVDPKAGVTSGGDTVTVIGTGFVDSTTGRQEAEFLAVLSCVFVASSNSRSRFKTSATFVEPTKVTCPTPSVPISLTYNVFVSMSGQFEEDSQLGTSEATFFAYTDPVVLNLFEPIGRVQGGENVKVSGRNFRLIPGTIGSMKCRFGPFTGPPRDITGICPTAEEGPCEGEYREVPATYGSVEELTCTVNFEISIPQTVDLEISLNGVHYTANQQKYTFYSLTEMSPSSGPVHGGTKVYVKINAGTEHPPLTGFEYHFSFDGLGGFRGAYDLAMDAIVFTTLDYSASADPAGVRLPVQLAIIRASSEGLQFGTFEGYDFIFYNVDFTSAGPCMPEPCEYVVLPKDGLNRTIFLSGNGLWKTDTIMCQFFPVSLDSSNNPTDGRLVFDAYRSGSNTDAPITHPGMHEGSDFGGPGWMGCRAPNINGGSSRQGYFVSVAPNGQNFDHAVFVVMYINQPDVHSVTGAEVENCFTDETAGLIDSSLRLSVKGSIWTLPNGDPPAQLSCLFFSPLQGQQVYSPLLTIACGNGVCEGECQTPTNFQVDTNVFDDGITDQLVKTQLIISLNRRDPCMACGCNRFWANPSQSEGYANSMCIHEGDEDHYDQDSLISKYDEDSKGFCSSSTPILADTSFCGIEISTPNSPKYKKCDFLQGDDASRDDVFFSCINASQYAWHTFITPPEVLTVSPSAIGGAASFNTTASIGMAGNNLYLAWWDGWDESWQSSAPDRISAEAARMVSVFVRAQYFVRGENSTNQNHTLLIENAAYDTTTDTLSVQVPTPCLSSTTAGLSEQMVQPCYRHFPWLFDGSYLEVAFEISFNGGCQYTPASESLLVFEGAGCPVSGCGHGTCIDGECRCGVWGFSGSTECSVVSDSAEAFVEPTVGWATEDYAPYSIYESSQYWSTPCAYMSASRTACGSGRESELSCSVGPILKVISPVVGIRSGDKKTMLTVNLVMFQNSGMRIHNFAAYTRQFFRCYFGSCGLSSNVVCPDLPDSDEASISVNCMCEAPHPGLSSGVGEFVDVIVSQVNANGEKSPSNFVGKMPFRYFAPPLIENVFTMGESGGSDGLSVPICTNDESRCPANPFRLRAIGTNFLSTATIRCRVGGVVTTGVFVDSREMICNVPASSTQNISTGPGFVQVSLDSQIYTDISQSPNITFFMPPKAVKRGTLGFGVDPSSLGLPLERMFGENPGLLGQVPLGEYYQLGPSSGGTPLVFYLKEKENSKPGIRDWSRAGSMRLRFGTCQSSCAGATDQERSNCPWDEDEDLPPCTCDSGPTVTAYLNGTAGSDAGDQVYKMRADTPAVSFTGKSMMCFSANGVHYLPLVWGTRRHVESDRFYFRFYSAPIVSSLSITEAPLKLSAGNAYEIRIFGSNFLTRAEGIPCKYVEVGLCGDYSPRIFIQMGGPGLVTKGVIENVSLPDQVQTTSAMVIGFSPPSDLSQPFDGPYSANISISYNGYDFTPVVVGQTEIEFFRLPTIERMFPVWGHMDLPTVITISGQNFDNLPGRSKCRISDCLRIETRYTMVPATFFNSTTMLCTTTPRLEEVDDPTKFERMNRLCISFTPDGRDSTRLENRDVFDAMMQTVGTDNGEFRMSDDIRQVSTSSYASPIRGGTEFRVTVRDLIYRPQTIDDDPSNFINPFCIKLDASEGGPIESTVFAFVPTSATWAQFRPAQYGDVIPAEILAHSTDEDYPLNFDTASNDQPVCFMQVRLRVPTMPFPMIAELKISFDGGQNYVGPSSSVLFYIDNPAQEAVPVRGSSLSPRRPQLTIFADPTNLAGANPSISATQANALFQTLSDCNASQVACPAGPKCRFVYSNDPPVSPPPTIEDVPAIYEHDSETPTLTCTLPFSPLSGNWDFMVSMDGLSFQQVLSPRFFLFYEQPCVRQVYPTNGYFDAGTELLVVGENFLRNAAGEDHQMWCIFDFQNLVPSADSWTVARVWSQAFAACDTNTVNDPACSTRAKCRVPTIAAGDRPTVPALPRARVGIIVDGRCLDYDVVTGACINLLNADTALDSSGFFQYQNLPKIQSMQPVASSPAGGLNITVSGDDFHDQYNVGHLSAPPSCFGESSYGPGGFRVSKFERICNKSISDAACHGLTCRFDQTVTQARLEGDKILCPVPPRSITGVDVVNFSVSLNGETMEFSDPLPFSYAMTEVTSILPAEGTAQGGGIVSVRGKNFIDILQACSSSASIGDLGACLQCRFTATNGQSINTEGTFLNDELAVCFVPPASDLGYTSLNSQGIVGVAYVSVSLNGVEYTEQVDMAKYTYTNPIDFTGFAPTAGSIEGNTTVMIIGTGFLQGIPVQCKFGDAIVSAEWTGSGWSCDSPERHSAQQGGVFMGFSTNNFDFCELMAPSGGECDPAKGNCECIFTASRSGAPFFYHDAMAALEIIPPSGKSTGGTLIDIHGIGFQDYGQELFVWFGSNLSMPATIVAPDMIQCYSPAMSDELTPAGLRVYTLDVAVSIRVTSNNQSYTKEEQGDDCELDGNRENPYAFCDTRWVMYTWFQMPIVDTVKGGTPVSGFYSQLNPHLYNDLLSFPDIPQGPTSGGTIITVSGLGFTSPSRPYLKSGDVIGSTCSEADQRTTAVGEPCKTVDCDFPFRFNNELHYQCITQLRPGNQDDSPWCSVELDRITFSSRYARCNYDSVPADATWPDWRQNGKVITQVQCKFGDLPLVTAQVINNGTILCATPPSTEGIVVPISVTLNGRDFTQIKRTGRSGTYFQYLKPPPEISSAVVANTGVTLNVKFTVPTNIQGLQEQDRILKNTGDGSGCRELLTTSLISTLGVTVPTCGWNPAQDTLVVNLGEMATFDVKLQGRPGTTVTFNPRECEADATFDACTNSRSHTDLLVFPWIMKGCAYPSLDSCVQIDGTHPQWCGRCIPDADARIPELSYSFNQSVVGAEIIAPTSPIQPTPVILGAASVDTCTYVCFCDNPDGCSEHGQGLPFVTAEACPGYWGPLLSELDGTSSVGQLGRPFVKVQWGLRASETSDMSIEGNVTKNRCPKSGSDVCDINDLMAHIPTSASLLEAGKGANGTFCFTLTLQNWLGAETTNAECFSVNQVVDVATPRVAIAVASRSFDQFRGDNLRLMASIEQSECGSVSNISYQWSINPQPTGWSLVSTNSLILYIGSNNFINWDSEGPYTITLTTRFDTAPGERGEPIAASVVVRLMESKPVAVIAGNDRTVGHGRDLILNGIPSFDPDRPGDDSKLKFCWTCKVGNVTCDWTEFHNSAIPDSQQLTIASNELEAGLTYQVSLTVSKHGSPCNTILDVVPDDLSDTATAAIYVEDFNPPIAEIGLPEFSFLSDRSDFVLSGYVYRGDCADVDNPTAACGVDYKWTIDPPLVEDVLNLRTVGFGDSNNGYGKVYLTITRAMTGDTLMSFENVDYTVSLIAYESDYQVVSSLVISKNTGPTGGSFAVTPTEGNALDTQFTLRCSSWEDEDDPLFYKFTSTLGSVSSPLDPNYGTQSSYVTELPRGDSTNNFQITLHGIVQDSVGAETVTSPVVVRVTLIVENATLLELKEKSKVDAMIQMGDPGVTRHIGAIGSVIVSLLADSSSTVTASQLAGLFSYTQTISCQLYAPDPSVCDGRRRNMRRMLSIVQDSNTADDALANFVAGQQTYWDSQSTSQSINALLQASGSTCQASGGVLDILQNMVYNAKPTAYKTGTGDEFLGQKVLAIVQNCHTTDGITSTGWDMMNNVIGYTSVSVMQAYTTDSSTLSYDVRNGMGIAFKKIRAEASVSPVPTQTVTIPSTTNPPEIVVPRDMYTTGTEYVVDAIALEVDANPFSTENSASLYARFVSVNARPAISASTDAAYTISKTVFTGMTTNLELKLVTTSSPPVGTTATTGVSTGAVCAFWNTSGVSWSQFDTSAEVSGRAGVPLSCKTDHLTEFSLVEGTIGCDQLASANPLILNDCQVCGGGTREALAGRCDWNATPCLSPKVLDKCSVCVTTAEQAATESTKRFKAFNLRNETGICDFEGNRCQTDTSSNQLWPTKCGVCDLKANEQLAKQSAGICDCEAIPGGSQVVDRCNICGGNNISSQGVMDECGTNPDIPAKDVCHAGGVNSRWLSACTGCDEVARPEKPWVWDSASCTDPQNIQCTGTGGARVDACGVCDGDGSTCAGCDNQGSVLDICGVCNGTNTTCIGCDQIARAIPYQIDRCGDCKDPNDGFFGACDEATKQNCDYTTFAPAALCRQDCGGQLEGKNFDRCGRCGGTSADDCSDLGLTVQNWTSWTQCKFGVHTDACGKCGGDGTSCRGCSESPGQPGAAFSGLIPDRCGVCDGDDSSCIGCDGIVNSGKERDLCGICDGGNRDRDVCGVCFGDNTECAGCDGKPYSGRAFDACSVCGGTNLCKWRDGDPPPQSAGSTDAVEQVVTLAARDSANNRRPSLWLSLLMVSLVMMLFSDAWRLWD